MKKTYVDVLQALPPDETLHQFLASHGLAVPPALDAQPHEPPNRAVIEAIMTWGDTSARDRLTAELVASVALGDAAGGQAMFEATVNDPAVLTGLTFCQSDLHRSFWLYVRHRALFERASDLDRDLRRDHGYALYPELEFTVPVEQGGDAHARACVRMAEVRQSLALIRQTLTAIAAGPVMRAEAVEAADPDGEGLGWVEGTRGGLLYAVHLDDARKRLVRVKIKEPSFSNWRVFPFTVQDSNMMDYAINEASFGLSVAGADR